MVDATKLIIEVAVGLSSDMLIPERCRRWEYTMADYVADKKARATETSAPMKFDALCHEATEYAQENMDPSSFNFVRLDWIWL